MLTLTVLGTGHVRIQDHATPARTVLVSRTMHTAKGVAAATVNASAVHEAAPALNRSSRRRAGPLVVRAIALTEKYTGELLYEVTTICRDFVSRHRGRNYLFQLNPTISVDSAKVGNESRFINHDPNANCHACVRLVNGEHRIGLFALRRIEAGSELLLNYGDLFFEDDDSHLGEEAPRKDVVPPPDFSQDKVVYNLDQHSSDENYETHSELGGSVTP
ncbi:hypothetical protein DXG01_007684 [Tephrocybe rancida]|nr:hypothetical protein DXG01_007684 [Tephrocybe rancida]